MENTNNKQGWEDEFNGVLEGIGWEYDHGGRKDANTLRAFISKTIEAERESIRKQVNEAFEGTKVEFGALERLKKVFTP